MTTLNRRLHERFVLPAMYTSVAAARADGRPIGAGHAYDISETGVRIELDESVAAGETLRVELELPGVSGTVRADGRVMWLHDDADDPGPRRLALRFTGFASDDDRRRLRASLGTGDLRRAA